MPTPDFTLYTTFRHDTRLLQHPSNHTSNQPLPSLSAPALSGPIVPADPETSTQVPSPIYIAQQHLHRLLSGAIFFSWPAAQAFIRATWPTPAHFIQDVDARLRERLALENGSTTATTAPQRVRLALSSAGDLALSTSPAPPITDAELGQRLFPLQFDTASVKETWSIGLDTRPTAEPGAGKESMYFKTSARGAYTAADERCPAPADVPPGLTWAVLLYNQAGDVTEASYTSVYFYRDGGWVTPPVSCIAGLAAEEEGVDLGAQAGLTRRMALQRGLCRVAKVTTDSLRDGEIVWLSSSARGYGWGRLRLDTEK